MSYEYRVVPAPSRGEKAKGVKGVADRFSVALMHVMNELGAEGWEYLRAETLPCEERKGLFGHRSNMQHVLVFRRPRDSAPAELPETDAAAMPAWARAEAEPAEAAPEPAETPEQSGKEPEEEPAEGEPAFTRPRLGAARHGSDGPFPMVGPARKGKDTRD